MGGEVRPVRGQRFGMGLAGHIAHFAWKVGPSAVRRTNWITKNKRPSGSCRTAQVRFAGTVKTWRGLSIKQQASST
jgi:hypothetical protein